MYRLEYDLAVLNDMQDQVKEATGSSDKDGKGMMERVKQRRATRGPELSDTDAVGLLKQHGVIPKDKGE